MELAYLIVGLIVGGIIGSVSSVFIYRNNEDKIGPIADKVDAIKENVDGISEDVKELKK